MSNTNKIIILGLGGQGVITAGKLIAEAGFNSGYQVSFLPTTGPQIHNGSVQAEIIISNEKIYNPFIYKANYVLVFHKFRLEDAKQYLTDESILICKDFSTISNYEHLGMKVNTEVLDNSRYSNIFMVGAFNYYSDLFNDKDISTGLKRLFFNKPFNIVNLNFKAYKLGKDNQKAINKANV
ncbi:MAG: 2-oxoacid:acceptor oxidoreductase family protein [Candidatus Sericytochromatia bacterium]